MYSQTNDIVDKILDAIDEERRELIPESVDSVVYPEQDFVARSALDIASLTLELDPV